MPELPEVETICKSLEPSILSTTITFIKINTKKLRWEINSPDFDKYVVNQSIVSLARRGKYLILHLSNTAAVVIHLGMSGRLGILSPQDDVEKHTHVIFELSNGLQIRLRDPRRFGFIEVVPPNSFSSFPRFLHLGVEPLSGEFNADYLETKIAKTKRVIKLVLMDSKVVVGIGNIYANEALFYSGIDPRRVAKTLSMDEIEKLVNSAKIILTRAIERGGTTLNDFRNARGEPGFFQVELAVYGRTGEQCLRCGAAIQKSVIGGRSSFYCPHCQR